TGQALRIFVTEAEPERLLADELGQIAALQLGAGQPREAGELADQASQGGHLVLHDLPRRLQELLELLVLAPIAPLDLLDRELDRLQRLLDRWGEAPRHLLPLAAV